MHRLPGAPLYPTPGVWPCANDKILPRCEMRGKPGSVPQKDLMSILNYCPAFNAARWRIAGTRWNQINGVVIGQTR